MFRAVNYSTVKSVVNRFKVYSLRVMAICIHENVNC